ncbi:hypothetical protein Bra1253DRAFT_00233 [Bradyrhizobium sp. WSM1253]|nr:hypothetical protein Bra1253DRAFT_00233 [Bradyrhizobium sp. WSM1253]
MSGSYPLPTEPEGIVAPLLKRFHSGEISAIMPPYDAEAYSSRVRGNHH